MITHGYCGRVLLLLLLFAVLLCYLSCLSFVSGGAFIRVLLIYLFPYSPSHVIVVVVVGGGGGGGGGDIIVLHCADNRF